MKHYKNFKQYKDASHPLMKLSTEVLLLRSEDDIDWYGCQEDFKEDTVKVVYDELGIVVDYSTDVTRLVPFECSVVEFLASEVPNTNFKEIYVFDGTKLVERKPSDEKLKNDFESEKQKRLTKARDVLHTIELIQKNSLSVKLDESLITEWESYFVTIMTAKYRKSYVFASEPKSPF